MKNVLKQFFRNAYVYITYMRCLMNILNELTAGLPRCSRRANYSEFDAGELHARASN